MTLSNPSSGSYAVKVNTDGTSIGSVRMQLSGTKTVDRTENIAPYSLYGDNGENDLTGESLPVGRYTLTATAYQNRKLGGNKLGTLTVSFTVTQGN